MNCIFPFPQDGYCLVATTTTPSMFGMFSKEHECLFCLATRTVSAHCVFPQTERRSAQAPGTTLSGYESVICPANLSTLAFLFASCNVCCCSPHLPADLGLRTKAEDLTVDRRTEEPLMFLFARVQSQSSRLSFGYTQAILIGLYIFLSHNQSSFTYFRE